MAGLWFVTGTPFAEPSVSERPPNVRPPKPPPPKPLPAPKPPPGGRPPPPGGPPPGGPPPPEGRPPPKGPPPPNEPRVPPAKRSPASGPVTETVVTPWTTAVGSSYVRAPSEPWFFSTSTSYGLSSARSRRSATVATCPAASSAVTRRLLKSEALTSTYQAPAGREPISKAPSLSVVARRPTDRPSRTVWTSTAAAAMGFPSGDVTLPRSPPSADGSKVSVYRTVDGAGLPSISAGAN
jgi:hypothetical protein